MLTLPELKRLIKKYDETMGIDPKGKSKEDLRKEIEKVGYKIDDKNKKLVANFKQKTKKMPKKVDMPPKEKKEKKELTNEELFKKREKKDEETIKYIIANKHILKDKRIKN
jgi:hypothetical protein